MTSIPLTITNNYSTKQSRLTLYFNSYYTINNEPYFNTFSQVINGGEKYSGSVFSNFAYTGSQVYIFYYDWDTKNYGIFQSIKVPADTYSLDITLIKSCESLRTIPVSYPTYKNTSVQVGYISNNINSYIKSTSCSVQTGCWLYGGQPDCICVDTDRLQEDINSGIVGC